MRTTDEMLARELEPRPGDVILTPANAIPRSVEPITAGIFWPGEHTLAEIIAAARAIERLGYEPKLRFAASGDDPAAIELIVHDVPDLMTKLRASLAPSTNHMEARER